MQEEIWRDIKDYEGLYQISNFGRVKSLQRLVSTNRKDQNHKYNMRKERILMSNQCTVYPQVILSKHGKIRAFLIHRLVAQAFIPNPNNYPCINHKDENKQNNRVENLEWCSYKYNNEYNNRVERCKHKISQTLKEKQYHHKMTDEQREHIRQGAYKGWETRRARKSRSTTCTS